jgi:hypothetical protein
MNTTRHDEEVGAKESELQSFSILPEAIMRNIASPLGQRSSTKHGDNCYVGV